MAEMRFSAPEGRYKLCYMFDGLVFHETMVPSFTIVEASEVTLSRSQFINNYPNTFTVVGNGVSENDEIAFTAGNCVNATYMPIQVLHNEYGVSTETFPVRGVNLKVCYRFSGLSVILLNTTVSVVEAFPIELEEVPYNLPAKISLEGVGLTENDRLCMISSSST